MGSMGQMERLLANMLTARSARSAISSGLASSANQADAVPAIPADVTGTHASLTLALGGTVRPLAYWRMGDTMVPSPASAARQGGVAPLMTLGHVLNATSVNSLTMASLTVPANLIDSVLLVTVVQSKSNSPSVSGVTWNAVNLTKVAGNGGFAWIGRDSTYLSMNCRIEYWLLVAPAAMTANIVVTFTNSTGTTSVRDIDAVVYVGVDQTNPVTASASVSSQQSINQASVANVVHGCEVASRPGDLVISTIANQVGGTYTIPTGSSLVYNSASTSSGYSQQVRAPGAYPTVSVTWTAATGTVMNNEFGVASISLASALSSAPAIGTPGQLIWDWSGNGVHIDLDASVLPITNSLMDRYVIRRETTAASNGWERFTRSAATVILPSAGALPYDRCGSLQFDLPVLLPKVTLSTAFSVSFWLYVDSASATWNRATGGVSANTVDYPVIDLGNVLVRIAPRKPGDSPSVLRAWVIIGAQNPGGTTDGGTPVSTTEPVATDTWEHYGITWDGSTLRLYRNGIQQGTGVTRSGSLTALYDYQGQCIGGEAFRWSVETRTPSVTTQASSTGGASDSLWTGTALGLPGRLQEVAIWNIAIDGAKFAALVRSRTDPASADNLPYENEIAQDAPATWWRLADQQTSAPSSIPGSAYSEGTASQSLAVVTGVGTTWTSALVGATLTYANGTAGGTVTGWTSTTSLTVSTSQTVGPAQPYTLVANRSATLSSTVEPQGDIRAGIATQKYIGSFQSTYSPRVPGLLESAGTLSSTVSGTANLITSARNPGSFPDNTWAGSVLHVPADSTTVQARITSSLTRVPLAALDTSTNPYLSFVIPATSGLTDSDVAGKSFSIDGWSPSAAQSPLGSAYGSSAFLNYPLALGIDQGTQVGTISHTALASASALVRPALPAGIPSAPKPALGGAVEFWFTLRKGSDQGVLFNHNDGKPAILLTNGYTDTNPSVAILRQTVSSVSGTAVTGTPAPSINGLYCATGTGVALGYYETGTAYQSGWMVYGTGTNWTSEMLGAYLTYTAGNTGSAGGFVTSVVSATQLTVSINQNVATSAARITYSLALEGSGAGQDKGWMGFIRQVATGDAPNRMLVVIWTTDGQLSNFRPNGMTMGGYSLSLARENTATGASGYGSIITQVWYLLNPPADQSLDVIITLNKKAQQYTYWTAAAVVLANVDQANPVRSYGQSTSPTQLDLRNTNVYSYSPTDRQAGDLAISVIQSAYSPNLVAWSSNQTELARFIPVQGGYSFATGATNVAMSYQSITASEAVNPGTYTWTNTTVLATNDATPTRNILVSYLVVRRATTTITTDPSPNGLAGDNYTPALSVAWKGATSGLRASLRDDYPTNMLRPVPYRTMGTSPSDWCTYQYVAEALGADGAVIARSSVSNPVTNNYLISATDKNGLYIQAIAGAASYRVSLGIDATATDGYPVTKATSAALSLQKWSWAGTPTAWRRLRITAGLGTLTWSTTTATITTITQTTNSVFTVTHDGAVTFQALALRPSVTIAGAANPAYNGMWIVSAVTNTTTFTVNGYPVVMGIVSLGGTAALSAYFEHPFDEKSQAPDKRYVYDLTTTGRTTADIPVPSPLARTWNHVAFAWEADGSYALVLNGTVAETSSSANTAKLQTWFTPYSTGVASQAVSSTVVTGIGTTWTDQMLGATMTYANGVAGGTVTGFVHDSALSVSTVQTVANCGYLLTPEEMILPTSVTTQAGGTIPSIYRGSRGPYAGSIAEIALYDRSVPSWRFTRHFNAASASAEQSPQVIPVSQDFTSAGTATQSTTTVTSTVAEFTTAMIGGQLIFADGTSAGTIRSLVTGVATAVTVSTSQTRTTARSFTVQLLTPSTVVPVSQAQRTAIQTITQKAIATAPGTDLAAQSADVVTAVTTTFSNTQIGMEIRFEDGTSAGTIMGFIFGDTGLKSVRVTRSQTVVSQRFSVGFTAPPGAIGHGVPTPSWRPVPNGPGNPLIRNPGTFINGGVTTVRVRDIVEDPPP